MDNNEKEKKIEEVVKSYKSEMVAIRHEQDKIINEYKKEIDSRVISKLRNDIA